MDIDSYLPYEGKVVLKNKTAKEALVRVPLWVDKNAVRCRTAKREVKNNWWGQYLRIADLKSNDVITIEFPMVETTEKWTIPTKDVWGKGYPETIDHTCRFKGNTLVEMNPPIHEATFGRRKHYLADKAPTKKVTRYVTDKVLRW